MTSSRVSKRSLDERSDIRDYSNIPPDIAEPVITARAQLRSSSGAHSRDPLAHPGHALLGCRTTKSPFIAALPRCFRCLGANPSRRVVWHPAHTLGLKRVVISERAAPFTDLPQMGVELSWGTIS